MRFLLTGGAGALGSVLTQRLLDNNDEVIVFSRDESKHHNLRQKFPKVHFIIGDIKDRDSITTAIVKTCPEVIIHCAALKQVPAGQDNPIEFVKTNVLGTQNVIDAAVNTTQNCIFISSDKAVDPINVYGTTKFIGEKLALNAGWKVVRYGNVIESTGSVIPLFKSLIRQGKKLPITSRDMTRFLLSLDEAVDLIFKAVGEKTYQKGKVIVPHLSSAYILDIAKIMLAESGYSDEFIEFVGIRDGEKLHEKLLPGDLSSKDFVLNIVKLRKYLQDNGVI